MTKAVCKGIFWALLLSAGCAPVPPATPPSQPVALPQPPKPAVIIPQAIPPAQPLPVPRAEKPPAPPKPDPNIGETAAGPIEKSPNGPPAMHAVWDFGILAPGTEIRRRFTIANPSGKPWTIQFVSRNCSCTTGEFSQRAIPPSGAAWMETTLRLGLREGPVQQSIVVHFAELDAPAVFLVLKGEVRTLFSAVPDSLDLGLLGSDARPRREIELRNVSGEDLTIARVEAPDWLRVEHALVSPEERKDAVRQKWKMTLQAEPHKLKPGSALGTVAVHTSSPKIPPLLVRVSVERKALLEAVPNSLNFDRVEVGKTGQKTLHLELDVEVGEVSEKDLASVHDLGEELEVLIAPTAQPRRFLLTARFTPKQSRGLVQGKLEIRPRQESIPPTSLRVFAQVP